MRTFYHERMPNTSGIYRITCKPTGKFYIGSAVNLRKRRHEHFRDLRNNRHHSPTLQRAWNKYGPDAFVFEIIEIVLIPELLTAREQYLLDRYKPFGKRGFNTTKVAGSTLGFRHSATTRIKMSIAHMGKQPCLGFKHSEETRRKGAEKRRGTHRSLETRERMRLAALDHAPTNARTFILTAPDGTEYIVSDGLPKFCKERSLHAPCLGEVARGNRKHHKGWKARFGQAEAG